MIFFFEANEVVTMLRIFPLDELTDSEGVTFPLLTLDVPSDSSPI